VGGGLGGGGGGGVDVELVVRGGVRGCIMLQERERTGSFPHAEHIGVLTHLSIP